MSRTTLKATIAIATAAAATFTVPYGNEAQADFTEGQSVTLSVYGRTFTIATVTFGASAATLTWPADAPYALPPGEYYIDFDLVGADEQDRFTPAENQADSVASTIAALVIDHNALLAKLKAAGIMEPDA